MRAALICWLAGISVSTLVACTGTPPERPRLRLAFDLWAGYFPAHLASATGLFDSLDVRVELSVPENTKAMLADFSARRYDLIAASMADVVPVVQAVPDLKVLFCTDESAGADALVSAGRARRASDLRGGRVGVKLGGFAELLVRRILERGGVSPTEVELVDIDASRVPEALRAGQLVAGETWDPYLSELRAEGFPLIGSSAEFPGLIVECVVTHRDVLLARREELGRFAEAWFLAQDRLLGDTARSLEIVARALGQPANSLSIAGVRFLNRDENRRRLAGFDSATSLRTTLATYERFFGELGLLRARIDADRLLDGSIR